MSMPELIMLLEDALRGRYGGIVRAKGILETGGGYVLLLTLRTAFTA